MKLNIGDKVSIKINGQVGFVVSTSAHDKYPYRVFFTKDDGKDIFEAEELVLLEENNGTIVSCPSGLCVIIKTNGWLYKVVTDAGDVRQYGQRDCRLLSKLERALK